MPYRCIPLLLVTLLVGCDGALTPTQRLVGTWVGRPETAAERVEREWPGGGAWGGEKDGDSPKPNAEELPPPTDLEAYAELRVSMELAPLGRASLSLDGGRPLEGRWSITPGEGRRLQLEIEVDRAQGAAERRRFEIEMVRAGDDQPERFVLREAESDLRFGRLIFERASE